MSRLSLSMWSLESYLQSKKMSTSEFMRFAAGKGFKEVEVLDFFLGPDHLRELKELKAIAEGEGLWISTYAIGNDFAREAELARQVDYVKRGIEEALAIGVKVMRTFAGHPFEGVQYEPAFKSILKGYEMVLPAATEAAMTLAIENHGLLAGTAEQIVQIIETFSSPFVRATPDIGNFALVDRDPYGEVEKVLPYAANCHIKDWYRRLEANEGFLTSLAGVKYVGAEIGEGVVDVGRVLNMMLDKGYAGALVVEYEGKLDQQVGVAAAKRKLDAFLGERESLAPAR